MASAISPKEKFAGQKEKQWLPEQLVCRPELSWNAKGVWSRLARYAGNDCKCYPYLATLAKAVGLKRTATWRALQELVEHKLITMKLRRGQHRPSLITLLDHEWLRASDVPSVPQAERAHSAGGMREAGEFRQGNARIPQAEFGRRVSAEGSQKAEGSLLKAGESAAGLSDLNDSATDTTDRPTATDNPPVPVGSLSGAVEAAWSRCWAEKYPGIESPRMKPFKAQELIADAKSETTAAEFIEYVFQNFERLTYPKMPPRPYIGWVASIWDSSAGEGFRASRVNVKAEADQWFRDNPDATRLPAELHAQLQAFMKAKQAMQ